MQSKTKLLRSLRTNLRLRHYSPRTEAAYVDWVRRFVRYHGMRHPRELGADGVRDYLRHLAEDRRVAAATMNQARAAILFMYRDVLGQPLDGMSGIVPRAPVRIPVVLTPSEVAAVLGQLRRVPIGIPSTEAGCG